MLMTLEGFLSGRGTAEFQQGSRILELTGAMKKSEDTEIAEIRWSGLSVEKRLHPGSSTDLLCRVEQGPGVIAELNIEVGLVQGGGVCAIQLDQGYRFS